MGNVPEVGLCCIVQKGFESVFLRYDPACEHRMLGDRIEFLALSGKTAFPGESTGDVGDIDFFRIRVRQFHMSAAVSQNPGSGSPDVSFKGCVHKSFLSNYLNSIIEYHYVLP